MATEFELLISIVEEFTGTPKAELISKRRLRPLVELRMICINVLKENYPKLTVDVIGDMINVDHSTVSYHLKSHKTLLGQKDDKYKILYEKISSEFQQRQNLDDNQMKSDLLKKRLKLEKMILAIDKVLKKMEDKEVHEELLKT